MNLYEDCVVFINKINDNLSNINDLFLMLDFYLIKENYDNYINKIVNNKLKLINNSEYYLTKNLSIINGIKINKELIQNLDLNNSFNTELNLLVDEERKWIGLLYKCNKIIYHHLDTENNKIINYSKTYLEINEGECDNIEYLNDIIYINNNNLINLDYLLSDIKEKLMDNKYNILNFKSINKLQNILEKDKFKFILKCSLDNLDITNHLDEIREIKD